MAREFDQYILPGFQKLLDFPQKREAASPREVRRLTINKKTSFTVYDVTRVIGDLGLYPREDVHDNLKKERRVSSMNYGNDAMTGVVMIMETVSSDEILKKRFEERYSAQYSEKNLFILGFGGLILDKTQANLKRSRKEKELDKDSNTEYEENYGARATEDAYTQWYNDILSGSRNE